MSTRATILKHYKLPVRDSYKLSVEPDQYGRLGIFFKNDGDYVVIMGTGDAKDFADEIRPYDPDLAGQAYDHVKEVKRRLPKNKAEKHAR